LSRTAGDRHWATAPRAHSTQGANDAKEGESNPVA
jgi:hypothetical protein